MYFYLLLDLLLHYTDISFGTQRMLGRVSSRGTLWERYCEQSKGLEVELSPVTIPQGTARRDSPQISRS